MNTVDYRKRIKEIESEIAELHKIKVQVRREFLAANARFKVGDKVEVVWDEVVLFGRRISEKRKQAFISDVHDKYFSGKVSYEFSAVKKDGTMATKSAGIYSSYSRIELIKSS